MKYSLIIPIPIFFLVSFLNPTVSRAALISEYNFDNGTGNDSIGSSDLTVIGNTPDFSGGSYHSDGNSNNYLEWTGGFGLPDFTLSTWVYTSSANQGEFKAIFSNNDSSLDSSSFQITSHNGQYLLTSFVSGANTSFVFGAPTEGVWENLVLQKFGGNNARVYFNGQLVGQTGFNPGGLQEHRIGINRNSDNSYFGLIDKVQIWDDSQVSAADIYAQGPGLNVIEPNVIPEPTSILSLLTISGIVLGASKKK